MKIECSCSHCGKVFLKEKGQLNRAMKAGPFLFCSLACCSKAKSARAEKKTPEQRKKEKSEYDRIRRGVLADRIKKEKSEYHKRTYNPEKAAIERKKNMQRHVEYCRRPEYVAYKAKYDIKYRAKRLYGDFADAYLTLQSLEKEIDSRATRYEIMLANGTICKRQTRERMSRNGGYSGSYSNKSEGSSLGDTSADKGWNNAATSG